MSDGRKLLDQLRGVRVAPSILSADFARLGEAVDEVIAAGARVIHVDVMDGRFVPPITIGPLVVSALADRVHSAGAVLDCHLMISDPDRQIADFARAGADSISFHVEATPHADRLLGAIAEAGCVPGVALNPGTPVEATSSVARVAGIVLCMSVNPGWGGQAFIPTTPAKLEALRDQHPGAAIEVDGGIDAGTAPEVVAAGAGLLVAGSAIFSADDPAAAYERIAAAADGAG